ncbi:TMEM165/GDT1 family protein [Chamaesiphon sp. VAR_48_metabat_403]|uniref:TMEM165/GDT1 family protein n=1 Tax=Chamaesiphon sp. VAR_48_metabat_403 TaxID=2964700 RepID=UPI00286D7DDB|nr:TMEM165/GDT1 family protein [Chamaesiphon sp. VAR_48_metabat_403]
MLRAFTKALILVTSAELGDKSFFITILLSMRHPRGWVFSGTVLALGLMTVLSVLAGRLFASVDPTYLRLTEVAIFLGFGCKLLYRGWKMSQQERAEELAIARAEIAAPPAHLATQSSVWKIIVETFTLIFMAEWGDRTQFATIALATHHNRIGVTMGGILAHTICTAIAVFAGRSIAGSISEKLVNLVGGGLFIIFAMISIVGF